MLFAYGFGVLNCADCGVDHVTSAPQAAPFHAVVNVHVVIAVAAAGETEGVGEFDAVFVGVTGGVGVFDGVVVVVTVAVAVEERDAPADGVGVHDDANDMPVDAHPHGHAIGDADPRGQ
jgi:hypothetical protein